MYVLSAQLLGRYSCLVAQENVQNKSTLRQGAKNYHDTVFEQEINDLIAKTKEFYSQ